MSISNKLLPKAFAENAGSTYRYDIPDTNDTEFTNKATYDKGFPAVTMTDIAAGGIPPFGQDMNGVLCDLTTAIRYLQAGNLARYDASFATAIGGYLKNAVVSDLSANQYKSLKDNNTAELTDTTSWAKIDYLEKTNGGTVAGNTNFTGLLNYKGNEVITFVNSLGWGQTWQDVTSSRSANVTYTNTTGRPIFVSVIWSQSSTGNMNLIVDGNVIASGQQQGVNGAGQVSGIIPHGSTFRIDTTNTIFSWNELR